MGTEYQEKQIWVKTIESAIRYNIPPPPINAPSLIELLGHFGNRPAKERKRRKVGEDGACKVCGEHTLHIDFQYERGWVCKKCSNIRKSKKRVLTKS